MLPTMPLTEKQREYQRLYYRQHREQRLAASAVRGQRYKAEKRVYDVERRLLKGDELREYDRRRSKLYAARVSQMLSRAKARATKKGLSFTITRADIAIPEHCPVLGVKLTWFDKQGGADNSPSLDRRVPSLGYVPGNVVVICSKANRIKTNATAEEIQKVAIWVSQACLPPERNSADDHCRIESEETPS